LGARWGGPAGCRIPATTTPATGSARSSLPDLRFRSASSRARRDDLVLVAGRSGGGYRRAGMRLTPFLRPWEEQAREGARRRCTTATTVIRTFPGRYGSNAPSALTSISASSASPLALKSPHTGATILTGSWLVGHGCLCLTYVFGSTTLTFSCCTILI